MTTVEKIHRDFDNGEEEILALAEETIKLNQINDPHHIELMRSLGFTGSEVVKEAEAKEKTIEFNKELAERVLYYKRTYPFQSLLLQSHPKAG